MENSIRSVRDFVVVFLVVTSFGKVNKLIGLYRLYGILFILSHAIGKSYTTFQVSQVNPYEMNYMNEKPYILEKNQRPLLLVQIFYEVYSVSICQSFVLYESFV